MLRSRGEVLERGRSSPDLVAELRWQRTNEHDRRAIGVYVDGWHVGFVPRAINANLHALAVEIQPRHSTAWAVIRRQAGGEYAVRVLTSP